MGTAAWLRLIFSVVSVDNKSSEDTAEQPSNLCLRGWVRRVRAAFLPAAVAYVRGKSGAGRRLWQHALRLNFQSRSRASTGTSSGRVII